MENTRQRVCKGNLTTRNLGRFRSLQYISKSTTNTAQLWAHTGYILVWLMFISHKRNLLRSKGPNGLQRWYSTWNKH